MMVLTAAVMQSVRGALLLPLPLTPPLLLSNFQDKDRKVKMELKINQGYKLSHLSGAFPLPSLCAYRLIAAV